MKMRKTIWILPSFFFLSSLNSCFHSDVCSSALNLQNQIVVSTEKLKMNRSIASSQKQNKEDWVDWSEDRLKEAQRWMDQVQDHPKARLVQADLADIANSWVEFHGYAQIDRTDEMLQLLQKIEVHRASAYQKICLK